MRLKTVFVGVCLLSVRTAFAQQPPPSYSTEAYVVEQSRTSERFENDGTGRREQYFRIKAQSEAGVQQFGQLIFGYNAANESITINYVRVHKPDGTIITTPAAAVQDLSSPVQRIAPVYTDFRQKHVTVESFRPGDTLEADVVFTIHTALAPGQFWAEYSFDQDAIILDEQFDLDVPASRKIILKTKPGFDPAIHEADGRRVYHWSHANTVRKTADDEKKKSSSGEPERASIRVSTFADWAQVGDWFAALEHNARTITPEIRQKAKELTAGRATDLAKVEALYDFVSKNFRYVSLSLGAGRYQPRAAADVLKDEYGDCKDKATLLAALIEASGMQASPVLINSSVKLDPDFPSPSQFDHVITRAVVDGKEIWLDSTPEIAPFRMLAYGLRHKQALLVEPGSGSHVVETPSDTPFRSATTVQVDAVLDAAGTLSADVTMSFRGDLELLMRTVFRQTPAAQWQTLVQRSATQEGLPGDISNAKPSDPQDTTSPFTLTFHVRSPDFVDLAGRRVTVTLPMEARVATPDVPEDGPINVGPAGDALYSLKLAVPAGVTIQAPVPVDVVRDYAEYHSTYSAAGSVFTASRKVSISANELPQARRSDYMAFMHVVEGDTDQKLSLDATALSAASAPTTGDAKELNTRAYARLEAGDYTAAADLFEKALKLDPKATNAWTNLGRAYLGLEQPSKAIEAVEKQIALNPYDEYAYYYLGRAYVAMHKYADAETAYQKQLEINPLDGGTAWALGATYMSDSQFDKAAAAYERAVSLNPKDAVPLVQLGKAYINLHRIDDALKSFDRAIALSPTPLIWNDVAYELALGGVNLDAAQRYAESAVAAESAASRNLDIQNVDGRSLGVVNSLASYWDTLGWVYFAKGDIARAKSYVRSAWLLAEAPEVGDHLGQILEKEGKRDEAVRQFATSLAAPNAADLVRKHLLGVAKPDAAVDALVQRYRGDLIAERTVTLGVKGRPGATADVVLLVAAPSTVEAVKVVGGDQNLTSVVDAVKGIHVNGTFPDNVPAKLLRRGTITCTADKSCTLVLTAAGDTKPVK